VPLEALINILKPAYAPCANFAGTCAGACTWDPERSLVPCAFGGATGELNEVRLVVVTAEPAHPPDTANYRGGPEDMLIESLRIFDDAMRTGILERRGRPNPFHRNMREVLDAFWPDLDLDAQLRRTWTTNTVLCTARITGGPHLRKVEATCAETYLAPQLALFADAFVLALGDKAKVRMRRAGLRVDADGHHPSSRSSRDIKRASWRAAAERFHHIREAMQLSNDRYADVERSVRYDTDRKIMRTKPMRTKLSEVVPLRWTVWQRS
jgi:hypothetical protein